MLWLYRNAEFYFLIFSSIIWLANDGRINFQFFYSIKLSKGKQIFMNYRNLKMAYIYLQENLKILKILPAEVNLFLYSLVFNRNTVKILTFSKHPGEIKEILSEQSDLLFWSPPQKSKDRGILINTPCNQTKVYATCKNITFWSQHTFNNTMPDKITSQHSFKYFYWCCIVKDK